MHKEDYSMEIYEIPTWEIEDRGAAADPISASPDADNQIGKWDEIV